MQVKKTEVNPLTVTLWFRVGELQEEHLKIESGALAMECLHWISILLYETEEISEIEEARKNIYYLLPSLFNLLSEYLWDRKAKIQTLTDEIRSALHRIDEFSEAKEKKENL